MTNGFEMAAALVERAKEHRSQIGDHGDPYEEALQTRVVGLRLRIIVKEIFDHLRSALDYAAREVCSRCPSSTSGAKVYFPIVGVSAQRADFRSRVGKVMPGVLQDRPDLVPLLESFQPFADPKNGWIAEFATLCNESKHERLTVSIQEDARIVVEVEDGVKVWRGFKPDGTPFTRNPLMMLDGFPEGGVGEFTARYLSLPANDEELLWFLDRSIKGVDEIVVAISAAT